MSPAPSLSETQMAPIASDQAAEPSGKPTTRAQRGKRSKIPRLKKWTPVIVTWLDAVLHEGCQDSNGDFECTVRKSCGHFIKRDSLAMTLAMEDDRECADASDCDSVTSIPLGMIQGVVVLAPKH